MILTEDMLSYLNNILQLARMVNLYLMILIESLVSSGLEVTKIDIKQHLLMLMELTLKK
jgi:hypothetical protein